MSSFDQNSSCAVDRALMSDLRWLKADRAARKQKLERASHELLACAAHTASTTESKFFVGMMCWLFKLVLKKIRASIGNP